MTVDAFVTILIAWNQKWQANGRSILILADNAGCHPRDTQCQFSNIKVIYLPPNTMSVVQPLDLDIQNTKQCLSSRSEAAKAALDAPISTPLQKQSQKNQQVLSGTSSSTRKAFWCFVEAWERGLRLKLPL